MLTNYHSHTEFCDGKATMEEFIAEAISLGFSHWGISPHSPLPMLERAEWALKSERVEDYIAAVGALKVKYREQIKIFCGMEIDYIDENYNPASEYFQSLPLDYRIGSVHMLRSLTTGELIDIDCPIDEFAKKVDRHFNGSTQKIVESYYKAQRALVLAGGYTFIGHSDKISSNVSVLSSKITEKSWYKDLVEEFLQLVADNNAVMEINTKAINRTGVLFPDKKYFDRMAELGISVIINSDTHRLGSLDVGLSEARELYKGKIITL